MQSHFAEFRGPIPDWKNNCTVLSEGILIYVRQSNLKSLNYVLFLIGAEVATALHIDNFDLDRDKAVRNRNVEALIVVQPLVQNFLGFDPPRSCSDSDFDLACVGKVDDLVDVDEDFAPRVPIGAIHGKPRTMLHIRYILYLLLDGLKHDGLELGMSLLALHDQG